MRRSLLLMISRPWFLEGRDPKVTAEIGAFFPSVSRSGRVGGAGKA